MVTKDGKCVPGTERSKTLRSLVSKRREARKLWKKDRKYDEAGYSIIYGARHRLLQHK